MRQLLFSHRRAEPFCQAQNLLLVSPWQQNSKLLTAIPGYQRRLAGQRRCQDLRQRSQALISLEVAKHVVSHSVLGFNGCWVSFRIGESGTPPSDLFLRFETPGRFF